jgi:alpha-tubulin suppressor-like RCC1 family protein
VPEKVTSSALATRVITDIDMNVNEGICVVASGTVYCNTGSYDSGVFTAVTNGGLSGKVVKKIVWANGSSSRCALTTENRVYCWGTNNYGQLGDGTNTTATQPTSIYMDGHLSGRTILDIEGGSSGVVCVTASDFRVYCWGRGERGLLGRGETEITDSNVPLPVDTSGPASGKNMISSVVSYAHACALDNAGEAYCWGGMVNVYGQLGNGTAPITKGLPMLVANPNPLSKKPGFFF